MPKLRILGLSLSREVNILALAAFVFSLISLSWQSFYLLRGSQLELALNERVNIVLYNDSALDTENTKLSVLFNTGVAFHNSGAQGYDAVVQNMTVRLRYHKEGKDRIREYGWNHFENYTVGAERKPIASGTVSANHLLVQGRNHVARQVSFIGFGQPLKTKETVLTSGMSWSNFKNILKETSSISLLFDAYTTDGNKSVICDLSVGKNSIKRLDEQKMTTVFCSNVAQGSGWKSK